jgi:hypothetical protein
LEHETGSGSGVDCSRKYHALNNRDKTFLETGKPMIHAMRPVVSMPRTGTFGNVDSRLAAVKEFRQKRDGMDASPSCDFASVGWQERETVAPWRRESCLPDAVE